MKREYATIDRFRIVAALLVVAIHISPLASIDQTADMMLTRVIARIAVPFFFMATGFFVCAHYWKDPGANTKPLRQFYRKTGLLYLGAIVLYLPVNLYNGYFNGPSFLSKLLRDLLLEGTFYHLWYLPAVLLGVGVVYLLFRYCKPKVVLILTACLYVIGLMGDSYYGLAEQLPALKTFYTGIFSVVTYTRNGLFFAPLFLVLGAYLAQQDQPRTHRRWDWIGLALSTAVLLFEGWQLHIHALPRHDSMYLTLPFVGFFLFRLLMRKQGHVSPMVRNSAMYIYILHPLCLIGVRGIARFTGTAWLLVYNGLICYALVSVVSVALSFGLAAMQQRRRKEMPTHRAWVEIDCASLQHNVAVIQEMLPQACSLMAVLKADAYGHGAIVVAKTLQKAGVRAFAVATVQEGVALRKRGIRGTILVLGYTHPDALALIKRYRLEQTVVDEAYLTLLEQTKQSIPVQVNLDTGMHRLGVHPNNCVARVLQCKHLAFRGIYTHLGSAERTDGDDKCLTHTQILRFEAVKEALQYARRHDLQSHVQSSYGLCNYPELHYDYARVGLMLYGVLRSVPETDARRLQPVLSLKARVISVREIQQGDCVGYDRAFIAREDLRIATISIGYADGLPRNLSNVAQALVKGQRANIVGMICMDLCMLDVTHIEGVEPMDIVTLIGQDGTERIYAEQVAQQAGTIANELLTRLGPRLGRVYRNGCSHYI